MNEIIDILMRRDGMTRNEALNLIEECREEIQYVLSMAETEYPYGVYDQVVDIIKDYLGLEPDYLDVLI